jgi:hypothetical protein
MHARFSLVLVHLNGGGDVLPIRIVGQAGYVPQEVILVGKKSLVIDVELD